jgi:ADP-dependent NAD(P)H-hydrate dehydratase / NAD(P)H-hydrate epimerase
MRGISPAVAASSVPRPLPKGKCAVRVTTAAEMRELDRLAIETYGIPGVVLMENAGAQVARILWQEYPDLQACRVAVLCGHGNNGGDGFVIARYLHNKGVAVSVFLMGEPGNIRGDAGAHLDVLRRVGVTPEPVRTAESAQAVGARLADYDVLLDALLGTGLRAEVSGVFQLIIAAMNAAGRPILSVDIPSGLSADTGTPLGEPVRASLTVTMALPKRGLLLYPAAEYVGRLVVVDIGFPAAVREHAAVSCRVLEAHAIASQLRDRASDTHKGTYGHVLIVAGGLGKTGSGALASMAALRTGAGLVSYALPHSLNAAMEAKLTEAMTIPLPESEPGLLGEEASKRIVEWLEGKSALILGPGLGTHPQTVRCVHEVLRQVRLPTVLDADGLNALAIDPESIGNIQAPLVLTPHPGELARIRRTTTAEVQANRLAAAQETARACKAVVVLKGAHTVIAEPGGTLYINLTGNPGMATAGSGDVLSGMIGALLGQGYTPSVAARVAVHIHGLAGDLAAAVLGERSLIAGDLVETLPHAFHQLRQVKATAPTSWEHVWLKGAPKGTPASKGA